MKALSTAFWVMASVPLLAIDLLHRFWVWVESLYIKSPTTHGDAAWATKKELRRGGNFTPRGFYLCRAYGKPVFSHHERSALMMAAPGTGKSQTIIAGIHALKLLGPSERPTLIISDSANEVYTQTRALLESLGYSIGKIDLQAPSMGGKYDVLSYIRKTRIDADVEDLCELLVPTDAKEYQAHFRNFARNMLQDAIILNVKYEGNTKTIDEIASEIIDDDGRESLIERMKKYGPEFAAIKTFEKLGKNEGPSMLSTSLNHLKVWRADRIKEVSRNGMEDGKTVDRGWTFEELLTHEKPVALFIRTGLSGGTLGGQFTRVIMGNAVNTVMRMWDANPRPLARPLRLIADEAADMGRCTAIVKAHNVLRKAHVTVMLCFLSKSALDATYGEDAATLWNGCDHLVFGGCKDNATNKAYSDLIGPTTRMSGSVDGSGASRGYNETGAPLIRPNQILQQGSSEAIAILGNLAVKGEKAFGFRKGQPYYL